MRNISIISMYLKSLLKYCYQTQCESFSTETNSITSMINAQLSNPDIIKYKVKLNTRYKHLLRHKLICWETTRIFNHVLSAVN